ncbi:FxSxx-COOH system tetratricopeptide repeat protein [Streptomyces cupreus]|uniref:Tetratricopeptide repeat protein n=1 Tax=Streptomyces cupreus TaxID=2759956 RepID=A0A7X1J848_9ACTN|nr:FxSxx-COOH system tetratricopeptide repeat protein [Streptomyces cupreus]MBC2905909.1 tetratricopeptide repeat protein [Streptomyces cupreus]
MSVIDQARATSTTALRADPTMPDRDSGGPRPRSDAYPDPHTDPAPPVLSEEVKTAAGRVRPPADLTNLPPLPAQPFVGRSVDLDRLRQSLSRSAGRGIVTQATATATAVSGLGGIGKTALVLRYAHATRETYSLVWWITGESEEQIDTGLADLALRLYPSWAAHATARERTEWALTWLERHHGWLLVYDNVEHPQNLTPVMGRLLGHGHQLVTSRSRGGWPEGADLVDLDVLGDEESVELLRATAGHVGGGTHDELVAQLAADLGHLPLALTQAGAYLRETRMRLDTYRERLARVPELVLTDGASRSGRTITQIWRTSLETIRGAHPVAVPTLYALAWFAAEPVPREVASRLAGAKDEVLAALAAYHLVTSGPDGLSLHRLVQKTLRQASPAEAPNARDRAERALAAECAGATQERLRQLLVHIQALASPGPPPTTPSNDILAMYRRGAEELISREQQSLAIPLMDRVVQAETHVPDDEALADRDRLADLHTQAGNPARAVELYRNLYLDRRRLHGPDAQETLRGHHDLALAHHKAGEAIRAVRELRTVVADRLRVQGSEHEDTLTARADLAKALQQAGHHEEAVAEFESVHADRERLLGDRHEDTLAARTGLARAHEAAGDHRTALRLYEAAVTDRTHVHGPDHTETLKSRGELASAHSSAGDPVTALGLYEELLADRERVQGEDHADTLRCRQHLTYARWDVVGPDAVLPEFEALAEHSARVRGPDDPATLDYRDDVARVRRSRDDYAQALADYEALVADYARALGNDHPSTLRIRAFRAGTRRRAGDHTRAVREFTELVTVHTRLYGPLHPTTLTARANLALGHWSAGQCAEAIRIFEALVPDRSSVLGERHPKVLATREDLARARQASGDHESAVAELKGLLSDLTTTLGHPQDHQRVLELRRTLAEAFSGAGSHAQAIEVYDELVAVQERLYGHEHPWTMGSREQRGLALLEARRYREAARAFDTLVADRTRIQGPEHKTTLRARHRHCWALRLAGEHSNAVASYEKLLADHLRLQGPETTNTLGVRNNLALARSSARDHERALKELSELLADRRRLFGADAPVTLLVHENLAWAHRMASAPEQAVALYEEVVAARTRISGAGHPDTLSVREELALARRRNGDHESSLSDLESVLRDRIRLHGSDHASVLYVRLEMAQGYSRLGKHEAAVSLADETVAQHTRVLGPDHPRTLTSRRVLAYVRLQHGRYGEAIAGYESVIADQERILDSDDTETFWTRDLLAAAHVHRRDHARAIAVLEQLVADRTAVQGPEHFATLSCRLELARRRELADDRVRALRDLEALGEIFERLLGPDHPDTLDVWDDIAWVCSGPAVAGRAVAVAEELVRRLTRLFGPLDARTLDARVRLVSALGEAGLLGRATAEAASLLEDRRGLLGTDHRVVLATGRLLALLLRGRGERLGAIRELTALIEAADRAWGPGHPDTTEYRVSLAFAHWEAGDTRQAAILLDEVCRQYAKDLPDEHLARLEARAHLIWLTADIGPADRAVRDARRLIADAARHHGQGSRVTLDLMNVLAHALLQAGKPDEALEVLSHSLRSYAALVPHLRLPTTPDAITEAHRRAAEAPMKPGWATDQPEWTQAGVVVEIFAAWHAGFLPTFTTELAHVLSATGTPEAAVDLLNAVHAARATLFGPDHPDTLESLTELAFACLEAGTPDLGPAHDELLAAWERVYGPDHPDIPLLRWRLRTARPAWRARLLLLEETPLVGSPARLEVRLERVPGVPPTDLGRVVVTAGCRSSATVDPPMAEYEPDDPTRFTFTAREPGEHDVRFTLYDHASGHMLQEIRAVFPVLGDRPHGTGEGNENGAGDSRGDRQGPVPRLHGDTTAAN